MPRCSTSIASCGVVEATRIQPRGHVATPVTGLARDNNQRTLGFPDCAFARYYGLVQAVLEEARKTETYKALREAEDAQVRSIWIDGEEITQF